MNKTFDSVKVFLGVFLAALPLSAQEPATPVLKDSSVAEAIRCYMEGDYDRAVGTFENVGQYGLSAKAYYYYGLSHAALNDAEFAVRYLKKAVEGMPEHTGYRMQLAKTLLATGNVAGADEELKRILGIDPVFVPALFQLGQTALDRKNFAVSAGFFDAVMRQHPRDFLASYYLGVSLANMGKIDSAIKLLNVCSSLNPRYVPCLYLLAGLHFRKSNFSEAARLYAMLTQIDSMNADYWYRKGLSLAKQRDLGFAVKSLNVATTLDTTNATYAATLGQRLFELGRYDSAAQAYTLAATLENDNPNWHLNLGLAYAKMDSVEAALLSYRRSIAALQPERIAQVYDQIGALQFMKKNYRQAKQAYLESLKYNEMDQSARFFLALSCDQMKDYSTAAAYYNKFLKTAPDSAYKEQRDFAKGRVRSLGRM